MTKKPIAQSNGAARTIQREKVITGHRIPIDVDADNIISEVVTLTPEWANDLLMRNPLNRPVNKMLVQRLVNDIEGGRWKFNGEAVIISDTEKLLDGQHRCHAIIKSGKSVKTLLVYGVPEDRYDSIDKGASRSNADVLGAARIPYSAAVASAAAVIYAIENKLATWRFRNEYGVLEFLKAHPALISSAQYIQSMLAGKRLIPNSIAVSMHYLMSVKDASKADEFWRQVITGDGIRVGMPEYFFREKLIAYQSSKSIDGRDAGSTKRHLACLSVLAWNRSRNGEEMHRSPIYSLSDQGFPEVK